MTLLGGDDCYFQAQIFKLNPMFHFPRETLEHCLQYQIPPDPLTSSKAATVFLQWDILVVKLEAVGDL